MTERQEDARLELLRALADLRRSSERVERVSRRLDPMFGTPLRECASDMNQLARRLTRIGRTTFSGSSRRRQCT